MDANKQKALDAALAQIERQFGKGTVMRMGDRTQDAIPAISTGSLGLDIALGIGGLPKGRVVEIYGPESSGKTTLTLSVIAECQKLGGTAAFIDAEHALDPGYAEKLGVKVEDLIVSQPDTGEQALELGLNRRFLAEAREEPGADLRRAVLAPRQQLDSGAADVGQVTGIVRHPATPQHGSRLPCAQASSSSGTITSAAPVASALALSLIHISEPTRPY